MNTIEFNKENYKLMLEARLKEVIALNDSKYSFDIKEMQYELSQL